MDPPSLRSTLARRRAARAAQLMAALMIGQQVAGNASRDALFLARFPVSSLPWMVLLSASISIPIALLAGRLLARLGPERLVPACFTFLSLLFLTERSLWERAPHPTALLIFVHVSALSPVAISAFWSLLNERFDPYSAKGLISRVATAGTLGGLLGGLGAERIGARLAATDALTLLAVLNLLCALLTPLVRGPVPSASQAESRRAQLAPQPPAGLASLLGGLRRSPYLLHLALAVGLAALVGSLFDYVLKARVTQQLAGDASLIRFFGVFYSLMGLAAFLLQSLLGRLALRRLGLAGTLAVHPVLVLASGSLGLLLATPWTGLVVRGLDGVLRNSFFRTSYELFYTPIPQAQKRSLKALIDVGSDCLGKTGASGLVLLALAAAGGAFPSPVRLITLFGLGASLASLAVARLLHRDYVGALESGLRERARLLEPVSFFDPEASFAVSASAAGIDRESLLRAIEAGPVSGAATLDGSLTREVRDAVQALASADPEQIRSVLDGPLATHPALGPYLIPLLDQGALLRPVLRALKALLPHVERELARRLLDPGEPDVRRRRIPRLLRHSTDPATREALLRGLADPRFAVRFACGLALLAATEGKPEPDLDRGRLLGAVRREIAAGRASVQSSRALDRDPAPGAEAVRRILSERVDRRRKHVFHLLALALEREPVQMAHRALLTEDPMLRGTALEYLDSTLPPEIMEELRPYLGLPPRARHKVRRQGQDVVQDLLAAGDSISMSLREIRARLAAAGGGPAEAARSGDGDPPPKDPAP